MKCPEAPSEKETIPSVPVEMDVPQSESSPWGHVSELSQPSSGGVASLKSPLQPKDIGVPISPEGRVLKPIDEDAIDQGYDSDGLRAPLEESVDEIFDVQRRRCLYPSVQRHLPRWSPSRKMSRKKL